MSKGTPKSMRARLRRLIAQLIGLVGRAGPDREFDDELGLHLRC